jgi:hypothetical protein
VGAAPFWVADKENPLSGVAVSPTALTVPVMPTTPLWPKILYDVNDAGALKLPVPNDDAAGVGSVNEVAANALNELVPAPKTAAI